MAAKPYSKPCALAGHGAQIEGWKPVEIIPVGEAVLCADCDAITRARNDHCLACGSHSIVHVDKLMNRQVRAGETPALPVAISDATGPGRENGCSVDGSGDAAKARSGAGEA